jgi:hypothetical protein
MLGFVVTFFCNIWVYIKVSLYDRKGGGGRVEIGLKITLTQTLSLKTRNRNESTDIIPDPTPLPIDSSFKQNSYKKERDCHFRSPAFTTWPLITSSPSISQSPRTRYQYHFFIFLFSFYKLISWQIRWDRSLLPVVIFLSAFHYPSL